MATNVQINTVTAEVVIGYEDGTTETVAPQQQKQFQLPDGSFCSITEVPIDDERPNNELPQTPAERFMEAWRKVVDKIREEIAEDMGGEINPL